MNDADRQPRTIYKVLCGTTEERQIKAEEDFVFASEIVRCNEEVYHWAAENEINAKKLENDDFTAQTSMAASYGYMQVTYVTALDNKWPGINTGEQNPTFLFDTQENRLNGGGSLDIGTQVMTRKFRAANGRTLATDPALAEEAQLEQLFVQRLERIQR